ncbi:hypothetical protein JCM1841_002508 [Sporobolomyces salmonicolor]
MSLAALKSALEAHGLLGSSIIPKSFTPEVFVRVLYLRSNVAVSPGELVGVHKTQEEPRVSFETHQGDPELYTLALLDPDAPSKSDPKWAPFRHWLVTGVKPGEPAKFGEALTSYMGPAPPAGTGPHRYAYLLYRQSAHVAPKLHGDPERRSFDIASFVKESKLELVGANFFLAENKDKK